MKPMKIAAVSLFSIPGDADANAEKICRYAKEAAAKGADLIVFPEGALTGYSVEHAAAYALETQAYPIFKICRQALASSITIAFGFLEKQADGRLFLSAYITDGTESLIYRKCHLGHNERTVFSEGQTFPTFLSTKARLGVSICLEAHIPDLHRIYREKDVEVMLLPYASGMSGDVCRKNWAKVLPARASDNGVFLIACNLLVNKNGLMKGGGVAILNPKGDILAEDYGLKETLVMADFDGCLPRHIPDGNMRFISYFDRRRPELY